MTMIPPQLAPCGVFCGACPSFEKSCLGCASLENGPGQKRKSKWTCKVRTCCYEEKGLSFCGECSDYPCQTNQKKLMSTHPEEEIFQYRHELPWVFAALHTMPLGDRLAWHEDRWTCPHCGGRIIFYDYVCSNCGQAVFPRNISADG